MDSTVEVKQIPYGLTDYKRIRKENFYYLDKSSYLPLLEKTGSFLFFIRPRRFGKSFFISLLEFYYDIHYKDQFAELFSNTSIYTNPTPEHNKYLVLSYNFSQVDPAIDRWETTFLQHIKRRALSFLRKYAAYLINDGNVTEKNIIENLSPAGILSCVVDLCRDSDQNLYVIIDEYDNFANTLLTTSGSASYLQLTHGEGILRSFFNVLKGGTTGVEAPIRRLFITGVSPITMDDVTSGFNIGEQISLLPQFNQMLGFTRQDVEDILQYYTHAGLIKQNHNDLLDIIDLWYGNYLFSKHDQTRMYNTDMILYFVKHCIFQKSIPDDLIDRNVRIDYGKLRHLLVVDQEPNQTPYTNGNFKKLKQIIETGEITSELVKGFPLEEVADTTNFNSLLFYFGLLTIKDTQQDLLRLGIPNETVRRLFYDYIKEAYRETGVFSLNFSTYTSLMNDLAYKGEWQPLFDYLVGLMGESLSLRDLITGEKSIQAFLNVYLGLSDRYLIHSEKELNKGYADLFMEPFIARYPGVSYAYLLELKYIPVGKKVSKAKLAELVKEASVQLKQYSLDKKFHKVLEKTTLIKLVLIFSGHQLLYLGKELDCCRTNKL